MNKRIIISESEKKSILSQHKNLVQNESELKKQSISEREMTKLINSILINEGSGPCKSNVDCKPLQKCINGKCETTTTSLKETGEIEEGKSCVKPNVACGTICCPPGTTCSTNINGQIECRAKGIPTPIPPVSPMNEELEEEMTEETSKTDVKEGKSCPPPYFVMSNGVCCPKGHSYCGDKGPNGQPACQSRPCDSNTTRG